MKRQFPLILCFICGLFMTIQYFIPAFQRGYETMLEFSYIVYAMAIITGTFSVLIMHSKKVASKATGWGYNVVVIVGVLVMILFGFISREKSSFFMYMFNWMLVPVQATMFSLLAFYIASAAFRAFRARTLDATLLLIAATIVMLGRVPLGAEISQFFPDMTNWILDYPNLAAKRGITIGVGLGMFATAAKIILGIERSWLGRGE